MTLYIKPYVEADVTPEVKDTIQGDAVAIDENDYAVRPKYWQTTIKENFISWLKGSPSQLLSYVELDGLPEPEEGTIPEEEELIKTYEQQRDWSNKYVTGEISWETYVKRVFL